MASLVRTPFAGKKPMNLPREDGTTEKNTLGQALRSARRYRGLTGKELGQAMGYKSGTQVVETERDTKHPGVNYLERVATALDISIAYQPERGWFWLPN